MKSSTYLRPDQRGNQARPRKKRAPNNYPNTGGTRPGLPNHEFVALTWSNMQHIGGPVMPEAAKQFGREIQANLGAKPLDEPFLPEVTDLIDPQEAERQLRAMMQANVDHFTNDGYVEHTWQIPTVRFFVGRDPR